MPSSPSLTANIVAEGMRAASQHPRYAHLVPEDAAQFYRVACDTLRKGNVLTPVINMFSPETRIEMLDAVAVKGLGLHYAMRKALVEQQTEKLIAENNITQVVVVGAGYDSLATRLHKRHRNVHCFEVDQPSMHQKKQEVFKQGQKKIPGQRKDLFCPNSNLTFVSADLAEQSLHDALSATLGYDPAKPTLFIAEGLTMYLPESANRKLFADMRKAAPEKSYVLFGALDEMDKHSAVADKLMQQHKEHYNWTMPYEKMPDFLTENGLKLTGAIPQKKLLAPEQSVYERMQMDGLAGENYYLAEIMPEKAEFTQPDIHAVEMQPPVPAKAQLKR